MWYYRRPYASHLFFRALSYRLLHKQRRRTILAERQPQLWVYIGGIARKHRMKALAIGGIEDHTHILLSIPANMAIAQAIQFIKTGSSKWMHELCGRKGFEWQEGYGAFSIEVSQVESTIAYICNQQRHHRRRDFQAEFVGFLRKHHIEYDPDTSGADIRPSLTGLVSS